MMQHTISPEKWQAALVAGAGKVGLDLSLGQLEQFRVYMEELERWNRSYNLTRIIEPLEIVRGHFLDSLNYHPFLGDADRVLDIGSGPGFPGLPLALVRPESRFFLCEARQKKVLFLEFIRRRLGLENVSIIHLHLSRQNAKKAGLEPFPAIVCRAVNVLRDVVPVAAELLAERGFLLFSDAAPDRLRVTEELRQRNLGLVLEYIEPCPLEGRARKLYMGRIGRSGN